MKAIVSLGNAKMNYYQGLYRLGESLKGRFGGEFCGFMGEGSVGAPRHDDNPYAFKLYAIDHVRKMGFSKILWLDTSVYAVRPVEPVFNWMADKGVFMEEAGHLVGTWSPSRVLTYFGITKEQADNMPMFAAGYCGIDFTNPVGVAFFAEWWRAMRNDMFKGTWAESRHDMTCGSIIANKMGLQKHYSPGGQFFAYVGPGYSEPKHTAVFNLQGV